jgi:hypothetical protein
MVIVQRNFIPNYPQYLIAQKKWSESERKKTINSFLDNAVKGKLDYTGNLGDVSEIKIGKYYGRKLSYSAINPSTGERAERYSIIILVRDKLINFESWQLKENSNFIKRKEQFSKFNYCKIKETTDNIVLAKCGMKCKVENFVLFSRRYFSISHIFCSLVSWKKYRLRLV